MKKRLNWEEIGDSNSKRMKVFGGWLVLNYSYVENMESGYAALSESMCFVPDPNHEWEIEK